MRRWTLVAMFVLAPAAAQAKTVTEWTLDLLRDVVQWQQPPGQYKAVIVYRDDHLRASQFNRPLAGLQPQLEQAGNADDLYQRLTRMNNTVRIHCVILTDLEPDQVLAAEHFALDAKVVLIAIVSRRPEGGGVPFAFDPVRQVAFVRQRALRRYGLGLQSMPPKLPMVMLDTDDAYKDVDQCAPPHDPANNRANPEVVCHDNAFATLASTKREEWLKGIRDLDVAVLHAPNEAKDHKAFRGWGRGAYHPHIGLVEYLLKLSNCKAAWRELPFVHRDRHQEIQQRITDRCGSVTAHIAGNGIPTKPDWRMVDVEEAELLPPFPVKLVGSELFSLR
jgi:hypothetical protein